MSHPSLHILKDIRQKFQDILVQYAAAIETGIASITQTVRRLFPSYCSQELILVEEEEETEEESSCESEEDIYTPTKVVDEYGFLRREKQTGAAERQRIGAVEAYSCLGQKGKNMRKFKFGLIIRHINSEGTIVKGYFDPNFGIICDKQEKVFLSPTAMATYNSPASRKRATANGLTECKFKQNDTWRSVIDLLN